MKKKLLSMLLSAAMASAAIPVCSYAQNSTETINYNYSYDMQNGYTAENIHMRRMEKLNRGLTAVKTAEGVYLSWRLFDSEDTLYGSAKYNVSFNIYRNNETTPVATVTRSTNYIDKTVGESYRVAPVINGVEGEICEPVSVRENSYIDIELQRPDAAVLPDGSTAEYICVDASCGDLDGDGEYELVMAWLTSFSSSGMAYEAFNGPILLDAYKLDGTRLWDNPINLGNNIFTDQHNMQFLIYDFDGNGKAEITCQTSAGSKDAKGNYVNKASSDSRVANLDNSIDYRDEYGRTYTAPELFTIFNGEDGKAVDTIYYPIPICSPTVWGDEIANRSTRFLADVSYLDGEKPYAVYWRGYYTKRGDPTVGRTGIFGASFDGSRLNVEYVFDTYDIENSVYADGYTGITGYTAGNEKYIGQGNHNITTADVDNDGKDEVISGALCLEVNDEDKLMPKWCSFRGHGDALHIGDYDPTHSGLEYFSVHEEGYTTKTDANGNETRIDKIVTMPDGTTKSLDFGMTLYDAATGEEMFHTSGTSDTKGGLLANSGHGGYLQMNATTGVGTYIGNGNESYTKAAITGGTGMRIFWDGNLYDELTGGESIDAWSGSAYENIFSASDYGGINLDRPSPLLTADLFGDWREEIVYITYDYSRMRVFATTIPTNYKIKTLMHDPIYRSAVAAEATASKVCPHVGFYVGSELFEEEIPDKIEITSNPERTVYKQGENLNTKGLTVTAFYENGSSKAIKDYEVSGYDANKLGKQTVNVTYMGKTASFTVFVYEISEIFISSMPHSTVNYLGAPLNTDGLSVSARYINGAEELLLADDYTITYSPELGEQTVTVTYAGKTAQFKVTVIKPDIGILNRTYFTDSTVSSENLLTIGDCIGNFTIEHNVRINSMPADCGDKKNDTDGFFMRFMNINESKKALKTGGGWYLKKSGDNIALRWKGSGVDKSTAIGTLEVGKTYKFKYDFINIGTGSDTEESPAEEQAYAALTVIDENGQTVCTASELPLRNFTAEKGNILPMNTVQIYNRAREDGDASITFSDASICREQSSIISVIGDKIVVKLTEDISGVKLIAAKYDGNALKSIEIFDLPRPCKKEITASFAPDKVFMWNGMTPLCNVKYAE